MRKRYLENLALKSHIEDGQRKQRVMYPIGLCTWIAMDSTLLRTIKDETV